MHYFQRLIFSRGLTWQTWISLGLLWYLVAIALAPSNKLYQQGLVLLLWLPTVLFSWQARNHLKTLWHAHRWICAILFSLIAWSLLTLLWTDEADKYREAKRLFYIAIFLLCFPVLACARPERVIRLMQIGGVGLAISALIAIIQFYWIDQNPFRSRLTGLGELAHPILGAYVIGMAAVWMLHWVPESSRMRVAWLIALSIMVAFVVMTQSRGAALALIFTLFAMPIWQRKNRNYVVAYVLITLILGFWFLEPIITELKTAIELKPMIAERGTSFRPEIFLASLQLIAEQPLIGLGLGTDYKIFTQGLYFDHSHNLLTHIAIEIGVPGLLLWCALWLAIMWEAWKARDTTYGQGILGMLVFSSLAMQFDAASFSGTPRAEWFISWLPIGLASILAWVNSKSANAVGIFSKRRYVKHEFSREESRKLRYGKADKRNLNEHP